MRKKWKYCNIGAPPAASKVIRFLCGIILLTLCSCNNSGNHTHISETDSDAAGWQKAHSRNLVVSNVTAVMAVQQTISPVVTATGTLAYDTRLTGTISAKFSGRIERLYVHNNFQSVGINQRLMDIYSPEMLTEQQNLIYLLKNPSADPALTGASRQKLLLLGLTPGQLSQIERTRRPLNPLPVYSSYAGHIHDVGSPQQGAAEAQNGRSGMGGMNGDATPAPQTIPDNNPSAQPSGLTVREGMYIRRGQTLFGVYSTGRVLVTLNIFPKDAALVQTGNRVWLTPDTDPGKTIHAAISYIEPVAANSSSTIKARVYLQSPGNIRLKIGTLVNAAIYPAPQYGLWVPKSAVLDLGKKKVVFVKTVNGYAPQAVQTDITADAMIRITGGLGTQDSIALKAQYLVDSESFIQYNNE